MNKGVYMDKRIVGRAVSLVFSTLIVTSTVLSMIVSIGDEQQASEWTVWDALWGIAMITAFSWSVIDIYKYIFEDK